jgi:hypothetical protein
MLIETGVAAEKGIRDNQSYMPETLEPMIAIDHMSRMKITVDESLGGLLDKAKQNRFDIFKCLTEIFIANICRYGTEKHPHESEHAYLTIAKEGFKRVGGDPALFSYRCIDGNNQNWNLFFFLTMN